MGFVTTWVGGRKIEVEGKLVLEYMEDMGCVYDDALFMVAVDKLKLEFWERMALLGVKRA